ncbi:poly(A)-specific ribonuclease PARN-like isoform X2 [Zootermopsis nevadensis]|uniref:poly(A)-specific ribonuclease PARN-like isoform X2 n=1 Tax=Zootermopsis nevadensis TaxID=136037 RepID=UPI000B8ECB5F|nr:poly(A)-specific ribonuclease PARN-like isoform X2 [Zootermopsis nevadensis]
MEVTRGNFREVLLKLERILPAAEFLAIDGEFTGLHTGQDVNAFDTPSQYYSKLRSGSMDFLLVQFGLCAFSYDKENDKYTHQAYNFYIFPKSPQIRSAPDPRFLCQSSSIEFLASEGFDFNKVFKEGISYLTQPEEQKLREHLEEKHKSCNNTISSSPGNEDSFQPIPIPDEYVSTIEDSCAHIKTFLASSEPEELVLGCCNAFVRKLIFQTVGQRFDSSVVQLESRLTDKRNRVMVVTRAGSVEERKKKQQEKKDKELQDLEDAVGFTSVLRKISESGKLVVGHNMLLDVCHVINQCYFPLPEDYSEFKEMVRCVFPNLLDTKYMSDLPLFKDKISSNALGHLFKTLSEEPFKMCIAKSEEDGHGYSSLDDKYHEAAYDAYITGLCFITMANHLGSLQKPEVNPVLPSSPLINPYMNKLFLLRVQDSPYINLIGEDPVVRRDHVFFVSFPKEWKTYDLTQLFSPFGSVFVAWLSDTSAYVALHHRNQASLVRKTLTQSDTYTVMTYAAHQQIQDGITNCKCAHSGGKSLCSSCVRKRVVAKQSVPSSPTASVRKRRLIEVLQEDSPEVQTSAPKRKRSLSFGDKTTYSNRIIDPIPEEQEMDIVGHTKQAASSQGDRVSDKNTKAKSTGGINSTSSSPSDDSKTQPKHKQFEESDMWD